jgi:peptidyl-prolyl cis-trans isomerase SurA
MRRFLTLGLLCTALTACAWGETIDRVVAIVNNSVVLQSDVDDGVRCEAFLDAKPLTNVSATTFQNSLDRLIDQELMRQQMGEFDFTISDEARSKVAELRKQRGASPEQWQAQLAAYGIDETTLATCVSKQLDTLAFVDRRLRPSIHIERAQVEAYYKDTLLPQLRQQGSKETPGLRDVEPEIREILVQRTINEMLATWLRNLRQQSRIQLLSASEQLATSSAQQVPAN